MSWSSEAASLTLSSSTSDASVQAHDNVSDTVSEKPTCEDLSELSLEHHFQRPELAQKWMNIYKEARYEGLCRFNTTYTWSKKEERRLVRTLDLRIMLLVWAMFLMLDLVRHNMSRAFAQGQHNTSKEHSIMKDLSLTQNDANNAQILFYACFLFMELPSGLIAKWIGPERWIPIQIISWSVVCAAQAAVKSRAQFYACRALLGILQGGFIPDMCLYLSYFYKNEELSIRMSFFYTVLGVSQVVSAFLSAGFLACEGLNGVAGWRYLFAFDGLLSGVVGIIALAFMPASITQTKTPLVRTSWFTEHEETILVNRLLRDNPTKGDCNNRTAVSWRGLWKTVQNVDLWPMYLIGLVCFLAYQPPTTYFSLILSNMGFNTLWSNVLVVPSMVLFMVNVVWLAWLARKLQERSLVTMLMNLWPLPCFIGMICMRQSFHGIYAWERYVLYTLVIGIPYPLPVLVGWVSRNAPSVETRAVSLCFLNMSIQVSSILSTRVYTDGDQPYYTRGNTALATVCGVSVLLCIGVREFYRWRNQKRLQAWEGRAGQEGMGRMEKENEEQPVLLVY